MGAPSLGTVSCFKSHYPRCTGALSYPFSTPRHSSFRWIGAKYERWYPLLKEELALVAKPNAKIISIGLTASKFLTEKGLYGHAGMVAHPAPMGLGKAGKEIRAHKECWKQFLRDTAAKDTGQFPKEVKKTLAQQKLVFDYMIRFKRIRNQEKTGWVARSREWQRRLV